MEIDDSVRYFANCMQEWMERAPNEHLHLAAPNVFIPTDLSIKNAHEKVWFSL